MLDSIEKKRAFDPGSHASGVSAQPDCGGITVVGADVGGGQAFQASVDFGCLIAWAQVAAALGVEEMGAIDGWKRVDQEPDSHGEAGGPAVLYLVAGQKAHREE